MTQERVKSIIKTVVDASKDEPEENVKILIGAASAEIEDLYAGNRVGENLHPAPEA